MVILRRLGLFVSALLFGVCLAVFIFLAGLHSIFSTPQTLETALQDSGVYEEITPNILSEQLTAASLPSQDIGIKNAFTQALPASFYREASEKIINGTYGWMRGSTTSPEFSIDISTVKSNFANNVAAYIQQQMDSLPACERNMAPPTSAKDALSLTCLPKHLSPNSVANAAKQQVLISNVLTEGDTITPTTLKDSKGHPFKEQWAFLLPLYRSYVPTLMALPIIVALLGTALVFLSATKRVGLRRVAWLLLSIGLIAMVLAIAGIELLHIGVRVLGLPLTLAFETQDKLIGAVELLAADAQPWWLSIGIGCFLIGIVLLFVLWLRRPRQTLHFGNK